MDSGKGLLCPGIDLDLPDYVVIHALSLFPSALSEVLDQVVTQLGNLRLSQALP
jgi:hypothetical protein